MRTLSALFIAGLCLATAVACSKPKPPLGRWEGTFQSADTMIVARLEIDPDGAIYVSAPDALDISVNADRDSIRQRLTAGLAEAWGDVQPRVLDFDGRIFRKPGGVAPQLEWDPDSKEMTMIVYPGTQPSIRIKMRAVRDFSANPWPG